MRPNILPKSWDAFPHKVNFQIGSIKEYVMKGFQWS